jgi:hypothetical protein
MCQYNLAYFELEPLKGDVSYPEKPQLKNNSWWEGDFQEMQNEYLNSFFGFRELAVRLNHQLYFNLFKKPKAKAVVIGKENYLFEQSYIDAYIGTDYVGDDSISNTLNRLSFINDTLEKLGKKLLIVFAPSKASFYPEYLPNDISIPNEKTNYKIFSNKANQQNLNVIDFNRWFMFQKNKSKYPLFPQHGIHWSTYGTALAMDSLIKKMEQLKNIDIPSITFKDVHVEAPKGIDIDIAEGMNLWNELEGYRLAYPILKQEDTVGKTKPKALIISDSFYWGMYNLTINKAFRNDHFWYYNKQVYPETFTKETTTDDLDFKEEINNHDIFVIMATEATLRKFGWGFVEKANLYFKGQLQTNTTNSKLDKKVLEFIEYIKKDKNWMKDIQKRSETTGISIDSLILQDAKWQIKIQ